MKKHYFLIAAEIVFTGKGENDGLQSLRLNGVTTNKDKSFPAAMIGRGQQVAQMQFFKRMGEHVNEVEVRDVVLINVSYLGEFTEEEFNTLPPEMQPPAPGAANDSAKQ
jgi:hypothetical protein